MLNNPNGQNPIDPMSQAPEASLSDQGMATDILDLDTGAQSNASTAEMPPMTATTTVAPAAEPAMPMASAEMGPSMPSASTAMPNTTPAEDIFDGIPSLAAEENMGAAPQFPNANEGVARPAKKGSIFGIFLAVIIIIALLGGALAAYNFWKNSADSANEMEGEVSLESEMGSENGTYDFESEDEMMDTLPLVVDNEEVIEEEEPIDVLLPAMDDEIILPPLSGDVLDYEEMNEEAMDTLEEISDLAGIDFDMEEVEGPAESLLDESPVVAADEDLDMDGLSNSEEESLGTNPYKIDSDNDGLSDREEVMVYNTDPMNPDSDADTYLDGQEVESGYNPLGEGKLGE